MPEISLKQTNHNPERHLLEFDVIDEAEEVVGFAQLRLVGSKAQDMPAGFESNIYYETAPEFRNKGYATRTLSLLLKQAAAHGLDKVIATVNDDNIGSIKVIENNGGKLKGTAQTISGRTVLKYSLTTRH